VLKNIQTKIIKITGIDTHPPRAWYVTDTYKPAINPANFKSVRVVFLISSNAKVAIDKNPISNDVSANVMIVVPSNVPLFRITPKSVTMQNAVQIINDAAGIENLNFFKSSFGMCKKPKKSNAKAKALTGTLKDHK
jgi:hypothetical protein